MKPVEITNFELYYNGIYEIRFSHKNEKHALRVYLSPDMLIKLLNNEGLIEKLYASEIWSQPIRITKTTINIYVDDPNSKRFCVRTAEAADELMCAYNLALFEIEIGN